MNLYYEEDKKTQFMRVCRKYNELIVFKSFVDLSVGKVFTTSTMASNTIPHRQPHT